MAEAKGSPASNSGGAAGVGGDFVGSVGPQNSYQALLAAAMGAGSAPGAPNVTYNHHQYCNPAGLIHGPMPAMHAPPPHVHAVRTPPPPHCAQSNNQLMPAGYQYQYWQSPGSQNGVAAAQQVQRGFVADWTVYNSSYMSLACGSSSSNNGYHQSSRLCSTTTWPNAMPRYPCYSTYPPVIQDHQAPSYHQGSNHEEDSGFGSSFRVDPPLVAAACFPPMSPASNNHSPAQFFDEATYTEKVKSEAMYNKKVKNSEEPPDMESEISDELDPTHTPVDENQNLNQGHESLTARFNCREYRIVLRKDLTNSDVGNIGRIVLPKRDAEANLPALLERDGLILKMDDFKLPATWNFKYRFWPNNKSRMYIMESTGEFVKSHSLEAGDTLIIYKSLESGKFIVRGEKATQQRAPLLCLECKEEGNNSEECRFAMTLHAKRT
ncbi:putative B3 domain-containing protein Os04g0676650 [Lolium rigidum]|uniref:putative B3 domain-containing protein Os04g0676650 n=1 Tax=Lolium rigidum TaxID=89674 RepID=UPI001F5CC748|nr:putative B3 domain-containing protein Os04g0676650 [Lolium rigidum]